METGSTYRPRLSRETRLLLTAGLLAVAVLWLLARIRFPERPVTPNPVPSVLSQLETGPKYDVLASEVTQLQGRVQPTLLMLGLPTFAAGSREASRRAAAIRFREDLAVTMLPAEPNRERWKDGTVLAYDSASGLAVAHVPPSATISVPVPWTPQQPRRSRYLAATDVSPEGVSLRPVFVGSLDPIENALWSGPVWAVPTQARLAPGSFLFTNRAELAGLVIAYGARLVILPGWIVLAEADRLAAIPPAPPGTIGIEVQDLTPLVASVSGATTGVVVTWVDAAGAAIGRLRAGDVIETADDRILESRQQWDSRAARLRSGEAIALGVRRRGELRVLTLVASESSTPRTSESLGLTLRSRARAGAEVVRVEEGTAADRAGLIAGDLITLIADVTAPRPAQVVRSFNSVGRGQRVMMAITRGDAHIVTTLER